MNHYFEAHSEYDIGVFVGDVNINLLNTSDINVTEYISMMEEQGFFSYVDKPSRITQTSSTLIDHIFIKASERIKKNIDISTYV